MRRRALIATAAAVTVLAGTAQAAVAAPADASAKSTAERHVPAICKTDRGRVPTEDIATAKLIIEYNWTDADIGVHGAFDDDGWTQLCVVDPTGTPVLVVGPRGQLGDLSMAGIFFESREPPEEEFSLADLQAAFPEGEYEVRARSHDGSLLTGAATFTHDAPAPPTITAPAIAEDAEDTTDATVPAEGLVVTWEPVTTTVLGDDVAIAGYQVIITKEVEDDPNGFSRPTYDVHVPASATSLAVPDGFLEAGTVYELEVLALEESGNQTISVGFFETE